MPTVIDAKRVVVLALLPLLIGCYERRIVKDSFEQFRAIEAAQQAGVSKRDGPPDTRPTAKARWAIELAAFEGEDREKEAAAFLAAARRQADLHDLHLYREPGRVSVMRGMYLDPNSPIVERDLERTRGVTVGQRSLSQAELVPLGAGPIDAGGSDALDLKRYAGMDVFSLQVAAFDEKGGAKFREAAEAYARQLREDGEQAYYYHGPHRSMVTVGLFTDADFSDQGGYGPRIQRVQKRHPHHIINGSTVYQKQGEKKELQETFVVRVI